jgi:hypothetical protein
MNRVTLLAQAVSVAVLLSGATAFAYRTGGRGRLWMVGGAGFAVLEVILVLSSREGPRLLTAIAVVPPVLSMICVVDLLARRHAPFAAQVLVGAVTGLVGYVVTAFIAYAGLLSLV